MSAVAWKCHPWISERYSDCPIGTAMQYGSVLEGGCQETFGVVAQPIALGGNSK
jgi:hypothetical protein